MLRVTDEVNQFNEWIVCDPLEEQFYINNIFSLLLIIR